MLSLLTRLIDGAEMEQEPKHDFRASLLGLFLPTIIIALGYGIVWLVQYFDGRDTGALARLSMFVLLLAVPLLGAYGLLRYITTSVKLYEVSAQIHAGFPSRDPVDIPYRFIEYVHIRYGLLGYLTKSATLIIGLTAKKSVEVRNVYQPEAVKRAIELEIARSAKKSLDTIWPDG